MSHPIIQIGSIERPVRALKQSPTALFIIGTSLSMFPPVALDDIADGTELTGILYGHLDANAQIIATDFYVMHSKPKKPLVPIQTFLDMDYDYKGLRGKKRTVSIPAPNAHLFNARQ